MAASSLPGFALAYPSQRATARRLPKAPADSGVIDLRAPELEEKLEKKAFREARDGPRREMMRVFRIA
jgi:hypothetical protein